MRFYWLILGILSVWRVTNLFQAEDGPWDLLVRWRRRVGAGFWGSLLDCFYCLSLWIAAPFAYLLGGEFVERLLLWPALSAGAILLERITNGRHSAPPVAYLEDQEEPDVMLRQEESAIPRDGAGAPGG